ncbi:TIR domain-containing protein, partial [Pseudomonas syringae]|uniref:TIR domain-containing protein n=1 Tax=Pseudomonas syringae TaxID=317 RepID=UPI001FF9C212
ARNAHGEGGWLKELSVPRVGTVGYFCSASLKEQPDRGRTIIEKFEQTSDVGYAVVLLTPDDIVSAVQVNMPSARARQNVIFELGYFAGKLGRGRVCLLKKGMLRFHLIYLAWFIPNSIPMKDGRCG